MKAFVECIPCVFLQALNASKNITTEEEKLVEIQHDIMRLIPALSIDMTPAEFSYMVLKEVYKRCKDGDPFASEKRRSNDLILGLYDRLCKIIDYSAITSLTALKIAVAGNIIDLGIKDDYDVSEIMRKAVNESLKIDDSENFFEDIKNAKNILYITDNAGEIVTDKLFIKFLNRKGITTAVKSRPLLNDATMKDAEYIGMSEVANVIETGSGMLGTILSDCGKEFIEAYNNSDMVIAKGQANFEALDAVQKNIYFLFTVKCNTIAKRFGAKIDDLIVYKAEKAKKKREHSVTENRRQK